MFTLTIAHRVCPALSQTAIGFSSKIEMVKKTTASLATTLREYGKTTHLHVILDGCPPEYRDVFSETFHGQEAVKMDFIETQSIGNHRTFAKQIDLLVHSEDTNYVYFSEDDYLYKPFAFSAMSELLMMPGVDFVTPLDHPDRYAHVAHERRTSKIIHTSDCHWRESPSTCLTFMTSPTILKQTKWIFDAYSEGTMDSSMWLAATKQKLFSPTAILSSGFRYLKTRNVPYPQLAQLCAWKWFGAKLVTTRTFSLWSPIPSLAIHLNRDSIPPVASLVKDWGLKDCRL